MLHYKLNCFFILSTCTFNCSSVVRPLSVDNFCNYSTSGKLKVCFIKHDQTICTSTIASNIINTSSSNLATTLTSSKLTLQQDKHTSNHHFTFFSFHLPSSILTDPVVNVITIPPKIWRKKVANNY